MEKKLIGKLCPFRRQSETRTYNYGDKTVQTSKLEYFIQCDPNCMFYYEKYVKSIHKDGIPTENHYEMACKRCDNFIKKE